MTLTVTQTAEQQAVDELEEQLQELRQEREEYLALVSDPRASLPRRTLSEIRDSTEICEAKLEKARATATLRAQKIPAEGELRKSLAVAVESSKSALTHIETASAAVDEAIETLRLAADSYNETLATNRLSLLNAGVPTSGAELDEEPIDLEKGAIEYQGDRFAPLGKQSVNGYLLAIIHRENGFPKEPGGWEYVMRAFRAGRYWERATEGA